MAETTETLAARLALAGRILAAEGIIDSFGHVTARHAADPGRFLMSRVRAAELVEPADILELRLDGTPVRPIEARIFAERVIHAEIYRARPDVQAVCHHHPHVAPRPCIHLGHPGGGRFEDGTVGGLASCQRGLRPFARNPQELEFGDHSGRSRRAFSTAGRGRVGPLNESNHRPEDAARHACRNQQTHRHRNQPAQRDGGKGPQPARTVFRIGLDDDHTPAWGIT
jgi:hypothetical protein